ncbi:MAG: GWxTD domain-containing protein [Candidatus Latescibacteria bacterium]|nr:GWxTD domain-containing protein [Candidatus Latescibacterota bacterium]
MKKQESKYILRSTWCFIFFALGSVLHASSPLSVDWASFKYQDNLALVEIYYACPYNVFTYSVTNDTISAHYQLSFYLKSITSPDSLVESSSHRLVIPSFQKAQAQDLKLLDGFGFFAYPGQYWFRLTIQESLFSAVMIDTIVIPDFSQVLSLSDIELASSVTADTTGGKFTKGSMRIIPNPDSKFGQSYEILYVYVEGYNLVDDDAAYQLSYRILNLDDSVIKSYAPEIKTKTGPDFAYTFALNTKGLPVDDYKLELILKDLSTNQSTVRHKPFSVLSKIADPATTAHTALYDTSVYYTEIKFLATPTELNQYHGLGDDGKKEFLRRFWYRYDFEEFVRRISYSDNKYKVGRIAGRDTDRGRIYIKYGAPDEIVVHTMIEHTKPHEHWYYYAQGFHFIFTDIHSNNNYIFIYSNTDAEPKHPNWEKYVDPLEMDELR